MGIPIQEGGKSSLLNSPMGSDPFPTFHNQHPRHANACPSRSTAVYSPSHGNIHFLLCIRVLINDRPRLNIIRQYRNLKDTPCTRANRHKRTIGRAAFFSQSWKHDIRVVITLKNSMQCRVKYTTFIQRCCRLEFIFKSKAVQKLTQPRNIVMTKPRSRDPEPASAAAQDGPQAYPAQVRYPALSSGHPYHRKRQKACRNIRI